MEELTCFNILKNENVAHFCLLLLAQSFFKKRTFIYLVELGLSCGCRIFTVSWWDLSFRHIDSGCSTQAWLLCSMWDLSSPTKGQTFILCIARQILDHWATREVPLVWSFRPKNFPKHLPNNFLKDSTLHFLKNIIKHSVKEKGLWEICVADTGIYYCQRRRG